MRFSIEEDDPGYSAYVAAMAQGCVYVYFNGALAQDCITADEERGFIERHRRDAAGNLIASAAGTILTEQCYGVVRIVQGDRDQARDRSIELLREWLTPAQRDDYDRTATFVVIGSHGGRYRVGPGLTEELGTLGPGYDGEHVIATWCFGPRVPLPIADVLLARKIALETDEPRVRLLANRRHDYRGVFHSYGVVVPADDVHLRNGDTLTVNFDLRVN